MKPGKKVGIWLRVSTEEQAKGEAPEHHEQRARQYAEFKEWDVIEIYHLEGVSGKAVIDHQEAQRMIHDIERGHITGLIFSKLARLGRNIKELLQFADIFHQNKADLISLGEAIDTSSPAGRLFFTMLSAMAQFEREEIAERVAASVPIRAKLGKPLGGQAPFGYQWVDKELIIFEKEAPIRKLMYELFLQERRFTRVANILNEQGYRTRKGAKFSQTTVERLLKDPVAKGMRRANYTKSKGDGKSWDIKPQDEWVFLPAPQIVTPELWESVNYLIEEQRKGRKPRRKAVHLFTGLAHCHCGEKMYILSNSPKYVCQKCRNKIEAEALEAIFHDQLKTFLLDENIVSKMLQNTENEIGDKQKRVESLIEQKQELKKELDQLLVLQRQGQIPADGFKEHYEPIFERYRQVKSNIPTLQSEIDIIQAKTNTSDEAISQARDLHSQWKKLEKKDKRAIIDIIVDRIIVKDKSVVIKLYGLPYTPKNPSLSVNLLLTHPTPPKNTTKINRNLMGSWRRQA